METNLQITINRAEIPFYREKINCIKINLSKLFYVYSCIDDEKLCKNHKTYTNNLIIVLIFFFNLNCLYKIL